MTALFEKNTLDGLKAQLLSEQQRLQELLSKTQPHLHRSEPLPADFAEQATETENDQVVEALNHEAQIELSQINKALIRIEKGTYGACMVCGKRISSERLKTIPHTPFCFPCASEK